MFGIGLPELIFIFVVGLIVLGPEKLPEVARQMAKFFVQIKKTAEDFKSEMDKDIGHEISEINDIKENLTINPKKEFEERLRDIYNPVIKEDIPEMDEWKTISKREKTNK